MKKKNKAFTLVEILLAMAILGVGLASTVTVFAFGIKAARHALQLTEASFIGQMAMEDCRRRGYDVLTVGATTVSPIVDLNGVAISEYANYRYTLVVANASTAEATNLKSINVSVNYGSTHLADFMTYITDYTP